MVKTKYRLCDQDRAEYGGPEWVEFDTDVFGDKRAGELERLEKDLGHPISTVIQTLYGEPSVLGLRAIIWLARLEAGYKTPFREFDIRTLRVTADAVPTAEPEVDPAPLDDSPAGSETPG